MDYVFAAPIRGGGVRLLEDDWWDDEANPALSVGFLIRLFEQPEILRERHLDEEINEGFWFVVSGAAPGLVNHLLQPPVPWEDRRRGLLGIGQVYEKLFAAMCTDHLGHLDRGPESPNPVNSICYMWWDLFPTWGGHHDADVDETILGIMSATLRLESEPCRESTLHGLGHWCRSHPSRVTAIIDDWLASEPRMSPELQQYARVALGGCIL